MKISTSRSAKQLSFRLALAMLAGLFIVNAYFIYTSYNNYIQSSNEGVLKKLSCVTSAAAMLIDGDMHQQLVETHTGKDAIHTNEQDSLYAQLNGLLRHLQVENEIPTNVYTLFRKDDVTGIDRNNFYFGVTSMDPCFRHAYDSAPQYIKDNYEQGGELGPYGDDHGSWISAFAPIFNSEVEVVAIVQADEQFDRFIAQARQDMVTNISVALLVLALVSVLLFLLIFQWVRKSSRKQDEQAWIKQGVTELNDRLRGEKELPVLTHDVIHFLSAYLDVQVGAIYLASSAEGELRFAHGYAWSKEWKTDREIPFGEGLVGQVARDKKPLLLKAVPDNYIQIQSGTGAVKPRQLLIIPLLFDNELKGIIEVATLQGFGDLEMQFIEQVVEHIAIAINTAQSRVKMQELLEETQQQSEELQTQQEELRNSNIELEERTRKITEQKNEVEAARAALSIKADQLERASKYKSEFLANMSHELRTPLNSVLILAKLLADNKEGNLTEKQTEFARVILSSGSDLLGLINDILDLSKVEAGKIQLDISGIEITGIRKQYNDLFKEQALQQQIDFVIKLNKNVPDQITTDKQRLDQILKNLLANAFKFTDEQGRVTLEVKPAGNDQVAFAVHDTGIGIPKDKQALIFQAFKQADGSTSRKFGGTGLGLSISREMAEMLGGHIELESEENVGSTFTLVLPVEFNKQPDKPSRKGEAAPKPATIKAKSSQPAGTETPQPALNGTANGQSPIPTVVRKAGKMVLIIEDDPNFARILEDFAKERHFTTIHAHQGDAGIAYARQYLPDAIILDMQLPVKDGRQVLEELKADPQLKDIPVHIMSCLDLENEQHAIRAIDVLRKPVSENQLSEAFDRLDDFIANTEKRVLVVEDDKLHNQTMMELIGSDGVDCQPAYSGREALELMKREHFDCIILDLGLPDMDGMELLQEIQNEPKLTATPVIIYTGQDLSKEEEAKIKRVASTIIIKTDQSYDRLLDEMSLFFHKIDHNGTVGNTGNVEDYLQGETVLNNRKILVVDDDMRNIYALCGTLEEYDVNIITAYDGKDALEKLEAQPDVDLVLMDIMMPEMDGFEATRKIREQEAFQNLPIIALTAKAMKGDREECIAAGASDYLSKPVDMSKLLSLMRVWLSK